MIKADAGTQVELAEVGYTLGSPSHVAGRQGSDEPSTPSRVGGQVHGPFAFGHQFWDSMVISADDLESTKVGGSHLR